MFAVLRVRNLAIVALLAFAAAGCGGGTPEDDPAAAPATQADDPATPTDDAASPSVAAASEQTETDLTVTAYVVAYHWGYALFDGDGTELERLEVPVGATVELVAVNDHAADAIAQLPEPVAATIRSISWEERSQRDVELGLTPDQQQQMGMTMSEVLMAAHDGHDHMDPTPDHGLMVAGVGAQAVLDSHADAPQRLVFTVEREGTYPFRCTVDCGFGHKSQQRELLEVTA